MYEPNSEEELAEIIRGAREPLCIKGGGTRGVGVDGVPLSTLGLSGIKLYEPGALTMVAGAGTPLHEIEATLAREGQMLAFEPYDLSPITGASGATTIGGVFATNASGPRRISVGAARDFLLGVRFVDGLGNLVANGGRVMKNVTGYDLVKLMAGSYGALGVLSDVSFKVLPKPETAATLMIYGPESADAVAIMARALGSPYDITGAYHAPKETAGYGVTCLRIEGFHASVTYRLAELRKLIEPMLSTGLNHDIAEVTDGKKVTQQWRAIRDQDNDHPTSQDVWRIAVKPSDAPNIAARLPGARAYTLDWGGGRIWALTDPAHDLRETLGAFSGHATLIHSGSGAPDVARFHPEPEPVARLTQGLRTKFDPRGILNTGLMA